MVEVKGHRQLAAVQRGVLLAVFQRGGRHLADGHQMTRREDIAAHLLQELMHPRAVGVEAATIPVRIAGKGLIFRDQVDHVEAQAVDAAVGPEFADLFQLGAHRRVLPVEIRLLNSEQVQIILTAVGMPLPGVAAKLGAPVVRQGVRFAVAPDIELTVGALLIQRLTEPLVFGRGMVQHHIQHDADPAGLRFRHQGVKIGHRAVGGIDGGVVCHVVAVIHLR